MVTVPHIMVGLERMLDYRGVGLNIARFHCMYIYIYNWIIINIAHKYVICIIYVHKCINQYKISNMFILHVNINWKYLNML